MENLEYSGRDNLSAMECAINYNRYLLRLIASDVEDGDLVVDFGAGSGTFSSPLAKSGIRVVCVETDPVLSACLASRGMNVLSDLERVEDGSIDYIYSLNVLEHIEDDIGVARTWFRKLRPGGKLLVYVPAFEVLHSSMDRKVGHLRRYKKAELCEKLSSAGFSILQSRYADSAGFIAALVYKMFDRGAGDVNVGMLKLYDKWVFPVSLCLDVIGHMIAGKNVYVRAVKL